MFLVIKLKSLKFKKSEIITALIKQLTDVFILTVVNIKIRSNRGKNKFKYLNIVIITHFYN